MAETIVACPELKLHIAQNGTIEAALVPPDDMALSGAVFCFSLMVRAEPVAGCRLQRSVAGYTEFVFPDGLEAGQSHRFSFRYAVSQVEPGQVFRPFNRAWLPEGGYVRLPDGRCVDVELSVQNMPAPTPRRKAPQAVFSDELRLVPQPREWVGTGKTLDVSGGFRFDGGTAFAAALKSADALAARNNLPRLSGGHCALSVEPDPQFAAESYRLVIGDGGVQITASDRHGAFYAAISLITLAQTHAGQLPCGTIIDAPRFAWRGQSLDCSRHFYQPSTILRLLDLLALMKLNRFHWHFNDDEAFRLEVECYPDIWRKTAFRGEGQLVPGVFGGGQGPTGGSYSLEFARDLVARAGELSIEVLPEIEVPAHAYALTRVFPDLREPADASRETSIQSYPENTMNPACAFTWEFLENLTREIMSIFPFAHLHLGCDERPPAAWAQSPSVKALMEQEELASLDDMQGWMMARLAANLREMGGTPCAWEEAAKGNARGIGNGALLFSWTGQGPGLAAARAGYDVVMSPAQHVYFDMAHTQSSDDWGARWAGTIELEDTIAWDPVPDGEPALEARIKGVQGTYWSEFTVEDRQMEPMLAPRILGLAEKAWRPKAQPATAGTLVAAAAAYAGVFAAMGWRANSVEGRQSTGRRDGHG